MCQRNEEAVVSFQVEKNKIVRQDSLRKKIKEHFSSKAHQICVMQLKESAKNAISKIHRQSKREVYELHL